MANPVYHGEGLKVRGGGPPEDIDWIREGNKTKKLGGAMSPYSIQGKLIKLFVIYIYISMFKEFYHYFYQHV